MVNSRFKRIPRVLGALVLAVFLMGLSFAGTSGPETVLVANATELQSALSDASVSGDSTIIYYAAGTSAIELSSAAFLPANVTLDLSASGGTLRVLSGGTLDVAGVITGGSLDVSGGTLLREFGSSITATITASSGGTVRGARVLTLENLSSGSSEAISAITYAGVSSADTSSYVTRAATGVLYVKMTGSNYSSYLTINTVLTNTGNLFRLGTANTDTLSLTYALTYGGLTGATLSALNPTGYTASDSAILLNNPTKDGFTFVGWTCDQLGVTVPQDEMVIPEGTTGDLTLIAVWVEAPSGGGRTGGGSSGSSGSATTTTDDAQAQQDQASSDAQAQTQQQSTRRTRTASSSTKVTFTSDVEASAPTVASVRGNNSFPWVLVFGGLAALGVVAFVAAKLMNRTRE